MARGHSAWNLFVTPYLRSAGPTKADKAAAMRRASHDWRARKSGSMAPVRRNPGPNFGKLAIFGALAFGAFKLYQSGQNAKKAAATKPQIPPYPALGTQMGL